MEHSPMLRFKDRFPPNLRVTYAHLVIEPVRNILGRKGENGDLFNRDQVFEAVVRFISGWAKTQLKYPDGKDVRARQFMAQYLAHPEEGDDYIEYYIAYVKRGNKHVDDDGLPADKKPPTDRQLNYLQILGYTGVVNNRRHAAELIGERVGGKNA